MNPTSPAATEPPLQHLQQRCGMCAHRVAAPAADAGAARMAAQGYARCSQLPRWRYMAERATCTLSPARFAPIAVTSSTPPATPTGVHPHA